MILQFISGTRGHLSAIHMSCDFSSALGLQISRTSMHDTLNPAWRRNRTILFPVAVMSIVGILNIWNIPLPISLHKKDHLPLSDKWLSYTPAAVYSSRGKAVSNVFPRQHKWAHRRFLRALHSRNSLCSVAMIIRVMVNSSLRLLGHCPVVDDAVILPHRIGDVKKPVV